jgi:alkaline phosphatase D
MTNDSFSLVQISDTHLDPANADKMQRVQTAFKAALAQQPDLIIHTGDISDDGFRHKNMFEQIKTMFDAVGVPWHVVPGNHDIGEPEGEMIVRDAWLNCWHDVFRQDRFAIQQGQWYLIGLNTQIIGSGLASEDEQLKWLDEQLDTAQQHEHSVGIFMHQPPFIHEPQEVFGDKSDYWALRLNARLAMIERFSRPHVKLIASGHTHWYRSTQFDDFKSVWCPSTDIIVDDAKYPAGGNRFGIIAYHFDGHSFTDQLVEIDVPWQYHGFNRPFFDIPGRDTLRLDHLVLDFTGTLSKDGALLPGVAAQLRKIAVKVRVSVCTADSFGTARQALEGLPLEISIIKTAQDKNRPRRGCSRQQHQ